MKSVPSVGHFEEAELLLDGSGERAALMAEELALEKVFRGARGVNGDERPAPAAHEVDLPGHDLLPDAGFPQNEHGRVRHAHVPDLFEQLPRPVPNKGAMFLSSWSTTDWKRSFWCRDSSSRTF